MSIARKFRKNKSSFAAIESSITNNRSVSFASDGALVVSMGTLAISKAAAAACQSAEEDHLLAFRHHAESLTGKHPDELCGDIRALKIEELLKTGSYRSGYELDNGIRVCVLTKRTADRHKTILMLQSEYDAGQSSNLVPVNPTRPMHLWGTSDEPAGSSK